MSLHFQNNALTWKWLWLRLRRERPVAVGSGPLLGGGAFSGGRKKAPGMEMWAKSDYLRVFSASPPAYLETYLISPLPLNKQPISLARSHNWLDLFAAPLARPRPPQRRDSIHPRRPITVHSHLADTSPDNKKNREGEEDSVVVSVLKLLKEEQFKQENWGRIAEKTPFVHLMSGGGTFALFKWFRERSRFETSILNVPFSSRVSQKLNHSAGREVVRRSCASANSKGQKVKRWRWTNKVRNVCRSRRL